MCFFNVVAHWDFWWSFYWYSDIQLLIGGPILLGIFSWYLFKNIISQEKTPPNERKWLISFFYIAMAVISVDSLSSYDFVSTRIMLIDYINFWLIYLSIGSSVIRLILTISLFDKQYIEALYDRMNDTQFSPMYFIFATSLCGFIYLLLANHYNQSTIIVLGYYYVSQILSVGHTIQTKWLVQNKQETSVLK
ncbi:hypothetical protein HGA91_04545 [candidate division WWE3 bacterium]|nr:hypothetical protein [candidate division WWE3 bacterium]